MINEQAVWAIVFLPLAAFVFIALVLRPFAGPSTRWAGYVTIAAIGTAFALSIWALRSVLGEGGEAIGFASHSWFSVGNPGIGLGFEMTVGILLGAGLGSLTAASIQGPMLQKIIGVFAIVIAIQMALDLKPSASRAVPGKLGLTTAGGVIGWASAIFGIGGGTLNVPFLTWRSLPMQQAVATSSACGLPIAAASALSFMLIGWRQPQLPEWSLGYVYLPAMVGVALTSMFFARFGARLAHRLSPRLLKRLFALLLLGVGVSFLV